MPRHPPRFRPRPRPARGPVARGSGTAPRSRGRRPDGAASSRRSSRRWRWARSLLFLAAGILFVVPGFLAGGAGAPGPTALRGGSGQVAATRVPGGPSSIPGETLGPQASFRIYRVQGGDTLFDIARRFAITQEALVCVNRALRRDPDLLSVGQQLQIPPQDFECPKATKTKKP